MKTYQTLSRTLGAQHRCAKNNNLEWSEKHGAAIDEILKNFPRGSGFDSGTRLDENSTPEKLIFNTDFHHMNETGMYDGWTQHQIIVTPSLELEYSLRITGRDRNDIKEYIAEIFSVCLDAEIPN